MIQLLREGEASTRDLAASLGLTDNAVRAHLAALERDGLVRQVGKRAGVRKPEILYALAPAAEQFFPKAYHVLLSILLDALEERLPPAEVALLMRGVGRQVASMQGAPAPDQPLRERVERAAAFLKDLGGLAEVEEVAGRLRICGLSCPLAAAASRHPSVCTLAAALLEELVGAPVQEQCIRGEAPRCAFTVG